MKPAFLVVVVAALGGALFLPSPLSAVAILSLGAVVVWERWRHARVLEAALREVQAELARNQELQARLQTSESELRSLLEAAPVAILQFDRHAKVDFLNEAFAAMVGTARETFLGLDLGTVQDEGMKTALKAPLEGRNGRYEGPYKGGVTGRTLDVDLLSRPLYAPDGSVRGGVVIVRDTTESRRAMAELREARDRYDLLVRNLPWGTYQLRALPDGSFRFEFASPRCAELAGTTVEAMQANVHEAFKNAHPEELVALRLANAEAFSTLKPFRWEGRYVVDGRERWLRIESDGVALPEGGSLWSGVISEVTERHAVEDELRKATALAEEASRAKGEFLATMSHEVRTPMNGVLGLLQLALREEKDARQRERLQKAIGAGKALLDVLNDVLDWSRIESGNLVLEETEFDLRELLQGVADLFEAEITSRGVRFETDMAPEIPVLVAGDPHRLRQILSNLVGNATKFTSQGRIRLEAFVGEVSEGRIELRLAVRDTGIGIPWEHIGRLFQPFQQVDSGTTRRYGGTGLGLAICRNLAERMHGSIQVESELGKGSAFLVSIRLGLVGEWHPPESRGSVVDSCLFSERRRILLVEDNALNQEIAKGLLEFAGYDVVSAWDGQECLDILAKDVVDLVLMDLHMPVMGGLEAARKLRFLPNGRTVPVIALTADVRPGLIQECLDAGMAAHVGKPFDPARLLALIEDHIKDAT